MKIEDVLPDATEIRSEMASAYSGSSSHIGRCGPSHGRPVIYTLVPELLLSWRHVRRSNPQPARVPPAGRLLGGLDLEVKPAI
jgi:hypothetical protein